MQIHVGTSGYAYQEWKGAFYPEDLAAADMLAYYAKHLRTVEINNTFYRMPRREVVEKWAADVPADFRFVLKVTRRVSHMGRLKNVEDPWQFVIDNARVLGDRLGALLVQLPPNFKCDLERLGAFLPLIPDDVKVSLEVRHDSWRVEEVHAMLRERDVALCVSDEWDDVTAPLPVTATWGYLRLREEQYDDAALAEWAGRIQAQPWEQAFVFFKHEEEAPGLAARLCAALGQGPSERQIDE